MTTIKLNLEALEATAEAAIWSPSKQALLTEQNIETIDGLTRSQKEKLLRLCCEVSCAVDGKSYSVVFGPPTALAMIAEIRELRTIKSMYDAMHESQKHHIARADAAEARVKELEGELSKVATIRVVKHDPKGYEAIYEPEKQKITINEKSTMEVLRHEYGHHTIKVCGGSNAEHEMYDDFDCEGLNFVGFAKKVDDLTIDLSEQKARATAAEARLSVLWKLLTELDCAYLSDGEIDTSGQRNCAVNYPCQKCELEGITERVKKLHKNILGAVDVQTGGKDRGENKTEHLLSVEPPSTLIILEGAVRRILESENEVDYE